MRAAPILTLLASVLVPNSTIAQTRAAFGDFRDWMVACDNALECRAMGFRDRHGTQGGALVIDRAADANAAPSLWISFGSLGDIEVRDGMTIEVSADGTNLGHIVVGVGLVGRDTDRSSFNIEDASLREAALGALRRAGRLHFALPERAEPFEISLDGASAALLFMDDRQRRVGTVTALVRGGDRPASAVPAPPALPAPPQLRADPAWRAVPQAVPANIRQRVRPQDDECSSAAENEPTETSLLGRVSADLILVQVSCWRGAYNDSYRFHLWNDRTGRVTPVAFPVPGGLGERAPQDILTNPDFHAPTLTLTHFSKGRGLGDCGSSGTWRWDGRAFRLVGYDYMPECQGLMPGEWLTLYRSR